MTPLEQAHERMADKNLITAAQARANVIINRLRDAKIDTMALALQDESTTYGKVIWFKQMMDTLSKATSGQTPCKDGCSHCCKMALNITVQEAEAIAKASGKKMTMPPVFYETSDPKDFEGVNCPMLVDDRCSVYEVRPFPCKAHYSVDKDNLLCRIIPGSDIRAPTLDTSQFALFSAMTYDNPLEVKLADIREFFPND